MKLSDKLYSYRKKAGMSQQELAEYLDVSRQTVSKWETGMTVPSAEKLIRLSKLYSAPLDVLTDDTIELTEGVKTEAVPEHRKRKNFSLGVGFATLAVITVVIIGIFTFSRVGHSEDESIPLNEADSIKVEELESLEKDDLSYVDHLS